MWHRFNPNPHGSGVGDCAVRAVAAATGQSWERAYIGLALTGFILGDMPSANRTWGAYLQKQGYKRRMVEEDPAHPRYIQTVWGLGYVFVPDGSKA